MMLKITERLYARCGEVPIDRQKLYCAYCLKLQVQDRRQVRLRQCSSCRQPILGNEDLVNRQLCPACVKLQEAELLGPPAPVKTRLPGPMRVGDPTLPLVPVQICSGRCERCGGLGLIVDELGPRCRSCDRSVQL